MVGFDDRILSGGPWCSVPGSEISWRFRPSGQYAAIKESAKNLRA
jgi:hypothetical protein